MFCFEFAGLMGADSTGAGNGYRDRGKRKANNMRNSERVMTTMYLIPVFILPGVRLEELRTQDLMPMD